MKNRLKETKSQERLINLMLQAGVEWPEGAEFAVQHKCNLCVAFSANEDFVRDSGKSHWTHSNSSFFGSQELPSLCPNWHTTIITREQYEARDGWITWHGGECPIANDVRYEIMERNGEVAILNGGASDHGSMWDNYNDPNDIIAYRIHKKQPAAEPCESVKACIPDQPTIEQLITEWKRLDAVAEKSREIADRDMAAFDRAAEAVEEALKNAGWN